MARTIITDEKGVEDEDMDRGVAVEIVDPFDPTKIRVETKTYTLDLLVQRLKDHSIDLNPEFQRHADLWDDKKQSRLIESMLIRIPLPAFYFDASNDDRWLVVDGLQRLTTVKNFVIDNSMNLSGLEFLNDLDGKKFKELPRRLQRRIFETQVTLYLIQEGSPSDVKFNIFKRINTGGVTLTSQEIRHALNQGQATEFLKKLAESEEFLEATDYGVGKKRMADRECVLRFIAFNRTDVDDYKSGDLDLFLTNQMEELNALSTDTLAEITKDFSKSMKAAREIFDNDAFRKRTDPEARRTLVNKALFEAWSVNLARCSDGEIAILVRRRKRVKTGFIELLKGDSFFFESISYGTGDPRKVRARFDCIESLVQRILQ